MTAVDPSLARESVTTRARLLVVDDEPLALRTLRNILGGAGYDVVCAEDVGGARRALDGTPFQLVLTDLYLGAGGTGHEVAEFVHQHQPAVPVVMLTGRPSFGAAAEAMRTRVQEIVVKPVDPQLLTATCRRVIQTAAVERRSRELETQNRVLATVAPRMIEAKDPTTSGHAERVVRYADHLARRCGLDAEVREKLRLAALLHDIGKIAVPGSILCKDGPLTRTERAVIMRHPEVGYGILGDLDGFDDVRRWVLQHHEKWNGRGYPGQLRGDEVDLPGRILILAEVFDALAEARSYKAAWSITEIVQFFRSEAGEHFDPDLAHLVADGLQREGHAFFRTAETRSAQRDPVH